MNEMTKATVQSMIRHAMQALAGVWVAKNPDLAGATEAGIVSLFALLWTYLDNKKKSVPPADKIAVKIE